MALGKISVQLERVCKHLLGRIEVAPQQAAPPENLPGPDVIRHELESSAEHRLRRRQIILEHRHSSKPNPRSAEIRCTIHDGLELPSGASNIRLSQPERRC